LDRHDDVVPAAPESAPEVLVLGLDIGGTSTRALLATADGHRLGSGHGPGGNPTSHGAERAAAALLAALRQALSGTDPGLVRAATLGMAGGHRLATEPGARDAFDAAWRAAGLRCPYTVVSDALVAYAAGTAVPEGTVLIAGTGAIAAAVRDYTLDRVADGHGWLLGDAGSGFWLGRQAVRVALADLDAHAEPGPLSSLVLTELLGSAEVAVRPRETAAALVQRVNAGPPVALAALAPLVIRGYQDGDQAAIGLVRRAADRLVSTVHIVREPEAGTPIVLAGGLLAKDSPLGIEVSGRLARDWPAAPRPSAGDGAAAAAWLAARTLPQLNEAHAANLHARLLQPHSVL
jgi:N-acetylglucosamine kinase-like BadF-type ATPase